MSYQVRHNLNLDFPIKTLNLLRGAIGAEHLGCFPSFAQAVFNAVWVDGKNMGDPEVVIEVLEARGLDAAAIVARSQEPEVKAELISNTEAAVARGVFGAPTLFMDGEMYFGQDRLDFVEEALAG